MNIDKSLLLLIFSIFAFSSFSQTTLTLQPDGVAGKDATIGSCIPCGFSTTNYGNFHGLSAIAWTNQGANSDEKALFEFDLSSIPASATIVSAELSLYFNPDDGDGPHSTLTNSNASYLRRVTTPWNELDVTWDTQPGYTTVNQVTLAESTSPTQDYPNIDVTALVQDMVNDPNGSFGFLLESISDQEYHSLVFASSDHPNSALRPKLVISYDDVHSNLLEDSSVEFKLYPNPTNGSVSISSNLDINKVEVLNVLGEIVLTECDANNPIKVDQLSPGNYQVKITAESAVGFSLLVIE